MGTAEEDLGVDDLTYLREVDEARAEIMGYLTRTWEDRDHEWVRVRPEIVAPLARWCIDTGTTPEALWTRKAVDEPHRSARNSVLDVMYEVMSSFAPLPVYTIHDAEGEPVSTLMTDEEGLRQALAAREGLYAEDVRGNTLAGPDAEWQLFGRDFT